MVGGWVRDRLAGVDDTKDIDIEVFGLSLEALHEALSRHGDVLSFGDVFPVLQIRGVDVDFALPVRTRLADDLVVSDPRLDFAAAARRRDLTVNALGWDPTEDTILDPYGGQRDLADRVLRATDQDTFGDDPLRALRVAQLAARLEFRVAGDLLELCGAQDLSTVAPERVLAEWRKLLMRSRRPSVGLEVLRRARLLRHFPALEALQRVPQPHRSHPEGDVWVHTAMVVDEAARLRDGGDDDEALMFAALAHDFGKPAVTVADADGAVRAPGHERAGVAPATAFLDAMRAPPALVARVCALVAHHLTPGLLVEQGADAGAYRRLAHRLARTDVTLALLARLATANHLGRGTDEARRRAFPAGEAFLAQARALGVAHASPADVVLGRHLLARGMRPGPAFGPILARCREIQDETGLTDAEAVLARALDSC